MAGAAAVARGAQGCVTFLERPWVHGPCAIANTYGELRLQKSLMVLCNNLQGLVVWKEHPLHPRDVN